MQSVPKASAGAGDNARDYSPEAVLWRAPGRKTKVSLGEVREGFLEEAMCKVDLRMVLEVQCIHTHCVSSATIKCIFSFSYLTAESLYILALTVPGRKVCFLHFNRVFAGL